MMNIYTFVDRETGENIHINSDALRKWCIETKPEIFMLPIKPELFKEFMDDNVISLQRVWELADGRKLDPIILVKDGTIGDNGAPNALMVDGHHRFALAVLKGQEFIEGHFLEEKQWRPFQMHGLPKVTSDELRRSPITKRNY